MFDLFYLNDLVRNVSRCGKYKPHFELSCNDYKQINLTV